MNTLPAPEKMTNKEQWDRRLILLSRLVFLLSTIVLIFGLGLYVVVTINDFAGVDGSIAIMIAGAAIANGVVGLLILTRNPRHAVGWLLLFLDLVTTFVAASNLFLGLLENSLVNSANHMVGFFLWIGDWVWFVWVVLLIIFIPLYFPDGRLLTRRWRIVALAGVLSTVTMIIALTIAPEFSDSTSDPSDMGSSMLALASFLNRYVAGPLAAIGMVGAMLSVILRYRRSGRPQRAQIRWVFFTILVGIGIVSQMDTISQLLPATSTFIEKYGFQIFLLFPIALPVVIGIAILRYRLYDIDIIIRQTVQYSIVSAVLAAVYFGSIAVIQEGITAVTGTQSPLAIVLSTLLIAALFNPLRQRVQAFIDRRFYRQKYDAEQVLAQFVQTARDEVEIDALQAELLRVVQAALQPETAVLWFKQHARGQAYER